jgi:hypothetical protein
MNRTMVRTMKDPQCHHFGPTTKPTTTAPSKDTTPITVAVALDIAAIMLSSDLQVRSPSPPVHPTVSE